jgi:hypothetical protein
LYVTVKIVVVVVVAAAALVNVVITVIVVEFPVLKFMDNPVFKDKLEYDRTVQKKDYYLQ